MNTKYMNMIEVLISIFMVDKGEIKVLLYKKNDEPYKGHWMLPSSLLFSNETIFECADDIIKNMVGMSEVYLENGSIYSNINRVPDKRVIGCSLLAIVDSVKANIERRDVSGFESEWFSIYKIPKMVGDHKKIIDESVLILYDKIKKGSVLKILFPSDLTLPELQRVYEQVLNKDLDRRNFRKKILSLGIIEPTGEKNDCKTGRPANLYRFKDDFEISSSLYEDVIK